MGTCYSIAPGAHAYSAFAAWFYAQSFEAPEKAIILTPNRRLARYLAEALRAENQGSAALLPQFIPLGEYNRIQMLQLLGHIPSARSALLAMPEALSGHHILHQITRQVMALQQSRNHRGNMLQALREAAELQRLLDACSMYQVPLTRDRLMRLASADFAQHWQESVEFLAIIVRYLQESTKDDPILTQAKEQVLLASLFTRYLPELANTPVIAFGSSGSIPYVRGLLAAIYRMPSGCIMLPGLDMAMGDADWESLPAGHPQHFIKATLQEAGITRAEISVLGEGAAGIRHISQGFLNAPIHKAPTPCIHALTLAQPEDEARTIAIILRETLEKPGKTALVVTPDMALMRRIAAYMRPYEVAIDSPPLAHRADSAAGTFILQWFELLASGGDMLALRALLEHSALFVGDHAQHYRDWLTASDIHEFRGKPAFKMRAVPFDFAMEPLAAWLDTMPKWASGKRSIAEWLAGMQEMFGVFALAEDVREAIRSYCDELLELDDYYTRLEADEMLALWRHALAAPEAETTVAPHPRLRMLTPVEARLVYADCVILAGFHSDGWGVTPLSGWLNQRQIASLELPAFEAQQSLTAHDVWMHCHAPEVFITYAVIQGGQPVLPHALYHRLAPWFYTKPTPQPWQTWAASLRESAQYTPELASTPKPPAHARPRSLRVSSIDQMFVNPYAIYAQTVLMLEPLDAYGSVNYASLFGQVAHRMIADIWQRKPFPEATIQKLLSQHAVPKDMQHFWRTRLQLIAAFAEAECRQAEEEGAIAQPELPIEQALTLADNTSFTLRGRMDCIIETANRTVRLTDYKTGGIPDIKIIDRGLSCQLTAYGILQHIKDGRWPESIRYLKLPDVKNAPESRLCEWNAEEWQAHAQQLQNAIQTMLQAETPFLAHPVDSKDYKSNHTEYDGISRVEEWG